MRGIGRLAGVFSVRMSQEHVEHDRAAGDLDDELENRVQHGVLPYPQARPRRSPARCASSSVMIARAALTQVSGSIPSSPSLAPSATAPAKSSSRRSVRYVSRASLDGSLAA